MTNMNQKDTTVANCIVGLGLDLYTWCCCVNVAYYISNILVMITYQTLGLCLTCCHKNRATLFISLLLFTQ